jgi:hypothetical protein
MTAPTPQALYNRPWPFYPEQVVPEVIQLPDGQVVKNPLIDGIDNWYQTFDPNATITLAANGRSQVSWLIPPAGNMRGDAELFYLMSENTGRYSATGHLSGTYDRIMMNAPITVNMLAGTAWAPHELSESIFMESAGLVTWSLRDLSGAPNNVTLIGQGRRFTNYNIVNMNREGVIEAFYQRASHPYWMTFDSVEDNTGGLTIGAGVTLDNALTDMTVPGDGDFVAYGVVTDADGTFNVEMFSGRGGSVNSSQPIPSNLFAAPSSVVAGFPGNEVRSASFPFRWRQPRLFNRQTKIHFRITDTSGGTNVIRLALFGRKIYYPELGKAPIEVMGKGYVDRPIATHGSGNWSALNTPMAGQQIWPGTGISTHDNRYKA